MLPDIEVALLRTAQEAPANLAKHAVATRVGLTLSYMEDLVTLDVRDDGVGFAVATNGHGLASPGRPRRRDGGFGLAAMRRRVEGVAGRLEIESVGMPRLATYSASKSAAWGYANAARVELAGQGTEVVGVHVGFVDTDLISPPPAAA
jgi:signal transduction histidine kinase